MCARVLILHLQKSVSEWMYKALQVELQDWQRDQEPDTDHEGFYQTSLPTIITQVNIHIYTTLSYKYGRCAMYPWLTWIYLYGD